MDKQRPNEFEVPEYARPRLGADRVSSGTTPAQRGSLVPNPYDTVLWGVCSELLVGIACFFATIVTALGGLFVLSCLIWIMGIAALPIYYWRKKFHVALPSAIAAGIVLVFPAIICGQLSGGF